MQSLKLTNLAIHVEIRWHRRVYDNRLNGWSQCPVGEPVCRDPPACGHHTTFICMGPHSTMGVAREMSEFNIKPPLRATRLIFPQGYYLKTFLKLDTSSRQRRFGIRAFPPQGELLKTTEPHLTVCQSYRGQLGPIR